MVAAHRVSYMLFTGPIPEAEGHHGMCVLHRCDTPGCVNPDHLFLGTNKDNVRDMDEKGRRVCNPPRGSRHHAAKLNEEAVSSIWAQLCAGKKTQRKLAEEYGVCLATINHIKTGRLWSHLTGART